MNRLLVSDLDGTLIDGHNEISKENIDAINLWKSKGNFFSIATGRLSSSTRYYADILDCNEYMICCSGATIYKDTKIIKEESLSSDIPKKLWDICRDLDIYTQIYSGDNIYGSKEGKVVERYRESNNRKKEKYRSNIIIMENFDEKKLKHSIHKSSFFFFSEKEKRSVLNLVRDIPGTNQFLSMHYLYDIINSRASKGNAALWLKDELNANRLYSIGDNENDISMLKIADHSAVMNTAPKNVKEAADIETYSAKENGLAKYIYFLLENDNI